MAPRKTATRSRVVHDAQLSLRRSIIRFVAGFFRDRLRWGRGAEQ